MYPDIQRVKQHHLQWYTISGDVSNRYLHTTLKQLPVSVESLSKTPRGVSHIEIWLIAVIDKNPNLFKNINDLEYICTFMSLNMDEYLIPHASSLLLSLQIVNSDNFLSFKHLSRSIMRIFFTFLYLSLAITNHLWYKNIGVSFFFHSFLLTFCFWYCASASHRRAFLFCRIEHMFYVRNNSTAKTVCQ